MLDRVFDNWCNEAALLLEDATAAEIDSVASAYVHAGPFFVLNLAHGNPIIVETNTLQADEEGEHYRPAPIFRSVDTWVTVPPGKTVKCAPDTAAAVRVVLVVLLVLVELELLVEVVLLVEGGEDLLRLVGRGQAGGACEGAQRGLGEMPDGKTRVGELCR